MGRGWAEYDGAGTAIVPTAARGWRLLGAAQPWVGTSPVTEPLALEQWRRRRPWTQKELSAAAGVSVGTVRGIEHGYYKSVRPRVMRAIAEALGIAPAAVLEFRPSLGLDPEDEDGAAGARDSVAPPFDLRSGTVAR